MTDITWISFGIYQTVAWVKTNRLIKSRSQLLSLNGNEAIPSNESALDILTEKGADDIQSTFTKIKKYN